MRKFLIITGLILLGGLGYMATHDPPLPDAPSIAELCRREASPSAKDQENCRAQKALNVSFDAFRAKESVNRK